MPDSRAPRRIVCLQPSATVILARVGELNRVVACTKYCVDVVPELRSENRDNGRRRIVADSWTSKAVEILAVEPDLDVYKRQMLHSADEFKMKAVNDVFQAKLVKRGVPLKGLTYMPLEPSAGGTVKQKISLQQGIPIEKAREIVKLVKNSKKKAQASIQGDVVRISGKDRCV